MPHYTQSVDEPDWVSRSLAQDATRTPVKAVCYPGVLFWNIRHGVATYWLCRIRFPFVRRIEQFEELPLLLALAFDPCLLRMASNVDPWVTPSLVHAHHAQTVPASFCH